VNPRVDALNRVVLTLLGLLVLAAGGLGIAAGVGAFPGSPDPRVLPGSVRGFAASTPWFWWAVAGASLLLALLGLFWLVAQLRSDRRSLLDLTRDAADGTTTVHGAALTSAVVEEVERIRGVTGAGAGLRERRGGQLVLTVDLAETADIGAVREALEHTVAHARQAVEDPTLPVDVQLRPGRSRGADRTLL
jgi:hypothetical protein